MMYQVTIFSECKENKPLTCTVRRRDPVDLNNKTMKMSIINDGLVKILSKKGWNKNSLNKYSYSKIKIREYHKEAVEKEKANKYELIKAMKYRSGEWTRPKEK